MKNNSKYRPVLNILFISILALLFLIWVLNTAIQINFILLGLGILLGATLNYFSFGFASSWRLAIKKESFIAVRIQVIMLAVVSVLFFGLIQWNDGDEYNGILRPVGLSIIVGAFMFGVGMQLAKNCTSGSIRAAGNLQVYSAFTIIFIIIGATVASYHISFWESLPRSLPVSLFQSYGFVGLFIQLFFLALIYKLFLSQEYSLKLTSKPIYNSDKKQLHPLLIAALLLVLLNFLVFYFSGRPWVISNIFPIWGIKISDLLHMNLEWSFWDYGITNFQQLNQSVWLSPTHLTTVGVLVGALFVALLRTYNTQQNNKYNLSSKVARLGLNVIGGLLMGYGAIISYGCNIGAFFSGIGSGSLHGWVWLVSAALGSWVGIKIPNTSLK